MVTTYRNDSGNVIKQEYPTIGLVCYWDDDGKYHRLDGPAIDVAVTATNYHLNHKSEWYYHGTKLKCNSLEEFRRLLKLKAFW